MSFITRSLTRLLVAASVATVASAANGVVQKDVIIVGGGASGAHAAFQLREKHGQDIILIEKADRLGGHVDTFDDKAAGVAFDYGVQSFVEVYGAEAFVNSLGVKTAAPSRARRTTQYVDFKTGNNVSYSSPAAADRSAALTKYVELLSQWEDILLPTWDKFPTPENIPEDLLMPFGDFVKKHGIEAAVPTVYSVTGMGVGDVMKTETIWVVQAFNVDLARSFIGKASSFVPASGRNIEIYEAMAKVLGKDVLYSSTVSQSSRSDDGVLVSVATTGGRTVKIQAKHLLISIEPYASNLAPFDLSEKEKSVFSKFDYSRIYAGIVTNPALPAGYSLTNLPEAAAPNHHTALPTSNFSVRFDWLGKAQQEEDLFRIMLVGDREFDLEAAKQLAQANFDKLVEGRVVGTPESTKLTFEAFANHGPMHMRTSAKELKAGFVQDLYSLQGSRSTWWTGAAWNSPFQTHIWRYNDLLLPKMLAKDKADK